MKYTGLPTLMSPVSLNGTNSEDGRQMSLVTALWHAPLKVMF
jgi:hypothetical protein